MKHSILRVLLATLLIGSGQRRAPPGRRAALAQRKNCMACHAIGKPLMGVVPRHRRQVCAARRAVDYLAQSIVKGSVGVWGGVPMPANTQLTNSEAHTLAQWVLSVR